MGLSGSTIWVIASPVSAAIGALSKQLRPPPFFDCSNHPEYDAFRRKFIAFRQKYTTESFSVTDEFYDEIQSILNDANDIGRRHEAVFVRWASSWDVYHLCAAHVDTEIAARVQLPEDLQKDFCFYGFAVVQWLGIVGHDHFGSIPGMAEWAHNARGFLNDASKFNAMHFLESSGWPLKLVELAKSMSNEYLGSYRPSRDAGIGGGFRGSARVAPEHTVMPGAQRLRAVAISYHTALIREPLSLWLRTLRHLFEIDTVVHVLDPSAKTSEDVERLHAHCRFEEGASCESDERLLALNELLESVLLSCHKGDHKTHHHFIVNAQAYHDLFVKLMGDDPELRSADVLLCGEPVYFCRLLSHFGKPVIGYISTPLSVYVRAEDRGIWYQQFYDMAMDPRHIFAVTTPVFGEWITYATGVVLPIVPPVCLYTDANYFPVRDNEVLLLRTVSLFWDSACLLNYFANLAADVSHLSPNESIGMVSPVRFVESTSLSEKDRKGYTSFAEFVAAVIFPYAFSQFWFYEFYAMGVPLFLPSPKTLPLYVNQDYAVCPDFEGHRPGHAPLRVHPHSPFDRDDFHAMSYWTQYTDYTQFPHIGSFDSIPELLTKLAQEDHRQTSRRMLQAHQQHLGVATTFWQHALNRIVTFRDEAKAKNGEFPDVAVSNLPAMEPESTDVADAKLSDELRDLSTRQPCGGTPPRSDSSPRKANDGDARQDHPFQYHARSESCKEGSHWWVKLRRVAVDPEVKIWARNCCCGSYGNRMWLRIGNTSQMESSAPCAELDVPAGVVVSTICSGVGEYVFVEARTRGGWGYFDEGIAILMLPEVRVLSRE